MYIHGHVLAISDYYSKDVVTCSSTFEDPIKNDGKRQRNLQHRVTFNELDENDTIIKLNSGEYSACGFRIELSRKRNQMIFQVSLS